MIHSARLLTLVGVLACVMGSLQAQEKFPSKPLQLYVPLTPGATGGVANNFANFLLGLPSSVGRDVNTYFPAMRLWQTFLYAADNWQISPKFTVNLGLRWEFYPPAVPRFPGGFSNYDFDKNQLVVAGVGGNPMNLGMVTRYKYFSPRVGLAFGPITSSSRVRGSLKPTELCATVVLLSGLREV